MSHCDLLFAASVPPMRRHRLARVLSGLILFFSIWQLRISAQVPNAPTPQTGNGTNQKEQTKRILGIIPNFRSVYTTTTLPPQSVKDKFVTASEDSFDYSSIFIPAVLAIYSLETNSTPEFGQGPAGYGRYFWHAAVDQTSENYMVEFVVPVIAHQDTRYYTLGHGAFLRRTGYALSRTVVTRSDTAKEEFNVSEVAGAGVSAGLSSLYYPASQRTFTNIGKEWGIDVAIDGMSFVAKEFWPDLNHSLFHGARAQGNSQP
jgi:hypothetical protein